MILTRTTLTTHPVSKLLIARPRVSREAVGKVWVCEASLVLQRLREIPVVQGDEGLDTGLEESIDQSVVEVHAGLVVGAWCAIGEDTGPGQGEAIKTGLKTR